MVSDTRNRLSYPTVVNYNSILKGFLEMRPARRTFMALFRSNSRRISQNHGGRWDFFLVYFGIYHPPLRNPNNDWNWNNFRFWIAASLPCRNGNSTNATDGTQQQWRLQWPKSDWWPYRIVIIIIHTNSTSISVIIAEFCINSTITNTTTYEW